MIMLPERFVERVLRELGADEGGALCRALEGPSPVSVRLNPAKGLAAPSGRPIGWSADGYYLDERPPFTLDPDFHAGRYYVQEASSQFVGRIVEACGGIGGCRVLDLCAAPGGKTTLYAALAGPDGLVVANEVVRNRASVLADNVRKWGLGNVAVTVDDPSRIARLEGWFDLAAVDAPCSGEGMFRKSAEARAEWSESNVAMCAERQRTILREAWRSLRPGGLLLYSTCTFNFTENEGVLRDFSVWAKGETEPVGQVPVEPGWGVVCGTEGDFRTFRFYPHRAEGEGFFAAAVRKRPAAAGRPFRPKAQRSALADADRRAERELSRWVTDSEAMRFAVAGDTYYGYRRSQAEAVRMLSGVLTVICSGVEMGRIFKERLRPAHALALYAGLDRSAAAVCELPLDEALRYLRRGEVAACRFAEGLNLVTARGAALGFAKRIGGRCNNMYPNSLRILKM